MKRVLPVVLLTASCLGFQSRVERCFDGGVCSAGVSDGGTNTDGGAFVPFDAGFFCADEWCWESPFPHGVSLNSVFAEGDDLVVAGASGMVAERIAGQWRSLQSQHSQELQWRSLWGRSMTDLWLAGDERAWHRTGSGWSAVGATFALANSQAVAGSSTDVFFSAGSDVFRLEGSDWIGFSTAPGEVMSLAMAFGALHGAIRNNPSQVAGRVTNLAVGTTWGFDAGATYSLFATSTALFAMGERTVQLDRTLQAQPLADVLRAGVEAEQQVFAANGRGVGVLRDGGFLLETSTPLVNAMAAGRAVVAVGESGLIVERRDGGWVDPTPTVTRSNVVAFVERSGTLFALTADCGLLERGSTTWTRRSLPLTPLSMPEQCIDVATDGTSLFVLTDSRVAFFDAALQLSGFSSLPPALEVRRLWRSESGALVVTSASDVFVRSPTPTDLFQPVRVLGGSGAWGVSGRGSLAWVCGLAQDKVAELDLSRSPPLATEVPGLLAHDCRAVLPLRDGQWALAARGGGDVPRVRLVAADGSTSDVELGNNLRDSFIEALVETPKGIAVASDRYAFIPLANPQLLNSPRSFSGITALTVWRGRIFAGGAGGSILQAAAP